MRNGTGIEGSQAGLAVHRGQTTLGQWTRIRLRTQTQLLDLLPEGSYRRPPRQIVFFHVPKSGGTSLKRYLIACLGGKRSQNTDKLAEVFRQPPPTHEEVVRAKGARFVHARCSWASVERLNLSGDSLVFTFLREPRSRLLSWHRFASSYPEDRYNTLTADMFARSRGLSGEAMFASEDTLVRCMIDNYMVRQFAGRVLDYPVAESEWPSVLEIAKANLRKLSFIGFNETYETDFARFAEHVHLPRLLAVPHENATIARRSGPADEATTELSVAMAPLVRWDSALYDFALSLRGSTAASGTAGEG